MGITCALALVRRQSQIGHQTADVLDALVLLQNALHIRHELLFVDHALAGFVKQRHHSLTGFCVSVLTETGGEEPPLFAHKLQVLAGVGGVDDLERAVAAVAAQFVVERDQSL